MLALWLGTGVLAASNQGGGAILGGGGGGFSRGIVRRYSLADLESDLANVARAVRRPKGRRERKQSVSRIAPAIAALIERAEGANLAPLALADLAASLAQIEAVAARQIAFAEWRDNVLKATVQALAEVEARRMIEEDEETAIMLIMMAQ